MGLLIKTSFLMSIFCAIVGSWLKLAHIHGSATLFVIAILTAVVFIILCLTEIIRSTKLNRSEKLMWTVGLIFMGNITGIVYLLSGRKRIVTTHA